MSGRAQLADRDRDGRADAGETIRYTFTVRNTGARVVTGFQLSRGVSSPAARPAAGLPRMRCAATSLAPGAATTCTTVWRRVSYTAARRPVLVLAGVILADAPGNVRLQARTLIGIRTDR